MSATRLLRFSIFAALALLAAAMTFGLWIANSHDYKSRLESRENYTQVFAALAAQPGRIPAELATRLHDVRTSNRALDTHTHAANMALVVVLFALLGAVLDPGRRWPLAGLTIGALVYPSGLALQAFVDEFAGQLVAAMGAGMVVTFGAIMCVRFLAALRRGT